MTVELRQVIADSPLRNVPFQIWEPQQPTDSQSKGFGAAATQIPNTTIYEIKEKQRGIVVWSLQDSLNDLGASLTLDAVFGGKTLKATKDYQGREGLFADGVAGPKTCRSIARDLCDLQTIVLPGGLRESMIEGESGNLIGAVNWSVPGGVDCHLVQRRVYDTQFGDDAAEKRAFTGTYQIRLMSQTVKNRRDTYMGRTGAKTNERAYRLGVFHHNYPALADKIAFYGEASLSSYYTSAQSWVQAIHAKFADGASVNTPLEWGEFYSLGSPEHDHDGLMVKYVTSWS